MGTDDRGATSATIWDPPAETMPREHLEALQGRRLADLVRRLSELSPFSAARLATAGVQPGDVHGLDVLPSLPFTEKQDLWDHYPFGLLVVPRELVARVHGSSGTGGRPTLVSYTRGDLELWAEMCARALGCAGTMPGALVHNAYGYGLFTGGLGLHAGGERMGCTVVPVSGGQTARQVTLVSDLRPEVLCCTPSFAVYLGEALAASGLEPADISIRVAILGAEPWSESLRQEVEQLLGAKALDIYGLSEIIGPGVACECVEAQAGLHVNEDQFLVEVVNPADGSPVPAGAVGELVFTTLTKEAMPVLRYRTGDMASLDPSPCPCGRTLTRMSKVLGRRDDMLVIRGVNVYPSEVEAVLLAEPALGPHYVLVVDRTGALPQLVVACEPALTTGPFDPVMARRIGADVERMLGERLGLSTSVLVLPQGTVPRTEIGKAVRVVERTPESNPFPGWL